MPSLARPAVYVTLIVLAIAAATTGSLPLALGLGGVKALLVGADFMELRHAARPHAFVYVAVIAVLVLGLIALTSGA